MAYTNKANIQNYLMINISDSFASVITGWIEVVKEFIDNYTGRTFEDELDTYKLYDGDGTNELLTDDFRDLTKIEILDDDGDVDYTLDSASYYYVYPSNINPKNRIVINSANAPITIFPKGNQNVKVYATFGYQDSVPKDIEFAATMLVAQIIQQGGYDVGREIKSEKLGEYSITYQDIEKMAEQDITVMKILDKYRIIRV